MHKNISFGFDIGVDKDTINNKRLCIGSRRMCTAFIFCFICSLTQYLDIKSNFMIMNIDAEDPITH